MKNILVTIIIVVLASLGSTVYAAKNSESPSPTKNQVQNQVKTQNQGEDSQLQINTQEKMGTVAAQVQGLLEVRTTGGIGEQVRQIAQEQNQAQSQIQTELGKVEGRSGLLKSLIGPDYQALKNMQKQMEQNQLRISQLELLQNQLTNQGDITMVQETIQALIEQNITLRDRINLEEQTSSLFGWLLRLLVK